MRQYMGKLIYIAGVRGSSSWKLIIYIMYAHPRQLRAEFMEIGYKNTENYKTIITLLGKCL